VYLRTLTTTILTTTIITTTIITTLQIQVYLKPSKGFLLR
jgi:hypothetical protein